MNHSLNRQSASFRDPSGFVFHKNGHIYRQINYSYQRHFEHLMQSGLYKKLIEKKYLICHKESEPQIFNLNCYKVIEPEEIAFISYPYEWCFSEFKDAALLVLEIQKLALTYEMTLKDASAYNIQFHHGKPILIDTLSFEKYFEGKTWQAYKQFCEHFLAPLLLMSKTDIRLGKLSSLWIDGIPLDLTARLLPLSSKCSLSIFTHIYLHAKSQKYYGTRLNRKHNEMRMSKFQLLALIDNLSSLIQKLSWKPEKTEWAEYYDQTNYNEHSFEEKKRLVHEFIASVSPRTIWDLGGNNGLFSPKESKEIMNIISFDIDPAAVEKGYIQTKQNSSSNILPLLMDLANPSSNIGWANQERDSLSKRGPADLIMALALIHHLRIGNNIPLINIAEFFSQLCHYAIIEFVDKNDSQVQKLLRNREDIFSDYDLASFERIFSTKFSIIKKTPIPETHRTLYLMSAHNV